MEDLRKESLFYCCKDKCGYVYKCMKSQIFQLLCKGFEGEEEDQEKFLFIM